MDVRGRTARCEHPEHGEDIPHPPRIAQRRVTYMNDTPNEKVGYPMRSTSATWSLT
jgi:hypothetical protein